MSTSTFDQVAQVTARRRSKVGRGAATKNLPLLWQEVSLLKSRVELLETVNEKLILDYRAAEAKAQKLADQSARERAAVDSAKRASAASEAADAAVQRAQEEAAAAKKKASAAKSKVKPAAGSKAKQ